MTEFNPATMNPAAIVLDNKSDNIWEVLILFFIIIIIFVIFIKNNSK
jgi:hypothetical protein